MISLTPIIKHLKPKPADFRLPWFRDVDGAAKYAQIIPGNLPLPAAWIVRAADRVRHAGERAEDVTLGFDVVIAIANARSHDDNDTDDVLLAYRRAVKDRLLGWEIEPDMRPLKFEGGQILEYTNADIYWRDRYTFTALITNYLPDPVPVFDGFNQRVKDDANYL
jgi:hypothetical protein